LSTRLFAVAKMAEAASPVVLVASIALLIDLGARVASRLYEFAFMTTNVPELFRSLATRLPLLISPLRLIASQAQAGCLPDYVALALWSVAGTLYKTPSR